MSKKRVLIIGGAGFIGSHTADRLYKKGYKVRILDNLSEKTHHGGWPTYLNSNYEKNLADARDKVQLLRALIGVDYVIHLAAQMDLTPDFSVFCDVNITSTALLYELIVEHNLPVKKVVVASSQFVYGEGRWYCETDGVVFPKPRTIEKLMKGRWNPVCPKCKGKIIALTNLESHQEPPNQYAISKYTQEMIALKLGKLYNIPSVAMRYSIVHGPRQSLKSAYSGALRIFTIQLLSGQIPSVYEDGKSQRDFVSVHDVACANIEVLENPKADYEQFNVGGDKAYTVLQLAQMVAQALNKNVDIKPNGKFRLGDIRHAVSSITKLKKLGWRPLISEKKIIQDYLLWVNKQKIDFDHFLATQDKLKLSGVVRSATM